MRHLIEIHLVEVIIDVLFIGVPVIVLSIVDLDRPGDVIPDNHPVLANELERAPIAPLQIIEMKVREGSAFHSEQNFGGVLCVNLKVAELAIEAENLGHLSEQPPDHADLMDGVQDYPAPLRAICAIPPPIILIGMPVG